MPTTANIGGCVFLSLDDGAKTWALKILNDFRKTRGEKKEFDSSNFLNEAIIPQYVSLYEGVGNK